MSNATMICAGIDTGKHKLDVALSPAPMAGNGRLQVENTPQGHAELSAWLRRHNVERVGIEATGGWEREVTARLRDDGFTVIVFQPAQVRAYARFHLKRAKNDRIDAALIADCAAETKKPIHAPPDPRLVALAERLTVLDQFTEDLARLKTRRETVHEDAIRQLWTEEIARIGKTIKTRLRELVAAIRLHPDLAQKLKLIASVDSIGIPTAVAILIRMPEIGSISREHAAALAGLAPYDDDSCDQIGVRHIEGGRQRLRKALYNAALAGAFHWNQQLKSLYKRLTDAGKPHKLALIACARKLLIFANAVVARGTPWNEQTTTS